MLYRSGHSNVPAPRPRARKLLLYFLPNWTHHSPTFLNQTIVDFERIGVQFSSRKIKFICSCSPSYTSCKVIHCVHTVQLHVKRSPRHFTSHTAPSRFSLSELSAVEFSRLPPSSSHPSHPLFLSNFPWLPRAKDVPFFTSNSLFPSSVTPSHLAPSFLSSSSLLAHKNDKLVTVHAPSHPETVVSCSLPAISHILVFCCLISLPPHIPGPLFPPKRNSFCQLFPLFVQRLLFTQHRLRAL